MTDSTLIWAPTRPTDGGVFYRAPLGTTLPTDASAPLDALFMDHGWCGEDGITLMVNRANTKHHAFGSDLVKTTQDNYEESLKLTLLESDPDVLETVFGADSITLGVDGGGNRTIAIAHSSRQLPRSAFVVEVVDAASLCRKAWLLIWTTSSTSTTVCCPTRSPSTATSPRRATARRCWSTSPIPVRLPVRNTP